MLLAAGASIAQDWSAPHRVAYARSLRRHHFNFSSATASEDAFLASGLLPTKLSSLSPDDCAAVGSKKPHEWRLCGVTPPCLVISIGVGGDWAFEIAAARTGCETHALDPTRALLQRHNRQWQSLRNSGLRSLYFAPVGLGNDTSYAGVYAPSVDRTRSALVEVAHLEALLSRFARGRVVDVLKVDCEGCEWAEAAHLEALAPSPLCNVRQLYLELHFSSTMGMEPSTARARLATFAALLRTHGFARYPLDRPNPLVVVGAEADQDRVPKALTDLGLDPVACCYVIQLVRRNPDRACGVRERAERRGEITKGSDSKEGSVPP